MVYLAGSEKEFTAPYFQNENDDGFMSLPRRSVAIDGRDRDRDAETERIELKTIRRSLSTLGHIIKELGHGVPAKGITALIVIVCNNNPEIFLLSFLLLL